MGIYFDEKNHIFWLNTPRSTYAIGIMEEEKLLGHLYYGAKIASDDVRFLNRVGDTLFSPAARPGDRLKFNDAFPMEYPTAGVGDFVLPACRCAPPRATQRAVLRTAPTALYQANPDYHVFRRYLDRKMIVPRWRFSVRTKC